MDMNENLLKPSRVASTISPGRRLKNFFPTLEFTIELVKKPDTFTTPDRTPFATFSDIFVSVLTLHNSMANRELVESLSMSIYGNFTHTQVTYRTNHAYPL